MNLNSDDIKREMDALCGKHSTEASDNILDFEKKHYMTVTKRLGDKSYGRFEGQFRLFFQLANELLLGLNYIDKSDWPLHRSTQFLFIVNNLRSLHNATFNLLRGHWEDSMSIMRTNLEAMIRIVWISCYSDRADAAVVKLKDGGREFNFTNFLKNELQLPWDEYEMMSFKIHGNHIAVAQDILKLNNSTYTYPIMVRVEHDKVWFEACLNYVVFLEVLYLEFIIEVLATKTDPESLSENLLSDAKRYVELKKLSMKTHKKDYWPQVADDIGNLILLVKECDTGEEFEAAWNRIRESGRGST